MSGPLPPPIRGLPIGISADDGGFCRSLFRDFLPEKTTITLEAELSGGFGWDDSNAATCTPHPRHWTVTLSGSADITWTRQATMGIGYNTVDLNPDAGKFILAVKNCTIPKNLINLGLNPAFPGSEGTGSCTCDAPAVNCTSPTTHCDAVHTTSDITIGLELQIYYDEGLGGYTVIMIAACTPAIGCGGDACSGSTPNTGEFLYQIDSLSIADAFANRTATVNVPLGDSNVTCDFTLTFS